MLQKPWFKIFIWFLATFFFFLASGVVISMFRPGPSENEVMRFMSGMMGAMDGSMMGVMMNIEQNSVLRSIIALSLSIMVPMIIIGAFGGFLIRFIQKEE